MKIKIKKLESGERLDKYLTDKLDDYSRSQIQKLIKSEQVFVNGKNETSHYSLREGDVVVFEKSKSETEGGNYSDRVFEKLNFDQSDYSFDDMLVDENKEFLILNKPSGLIVHGADHIKEITLADILIKKYPKLKKIGDDPARPAIVHRLDKDASGLIVIPKTQDSFDNIKRQFQKRTVKKEYTALVYGQVAKNEDEIRFPMKRSSAGYKMAAMPEIVKGEKDLQGGRRAITSFVVEERFINYTLLKVKIKTGRTHQIRCHMLAYGHSLVGDNLYSTRKTRELNKKNNLGRVFLTASRLCFKNLAGEEVCYQIDLPEDLKKFLKKLK